MNWIDFKKNKETPKDNSWVLIQSSSKNTPKFEVCIYTNEEWYLPSYGDCIEEGDVVKWAYIED